MGTFAWAALGLVLVGLSVVLYAKLSAGYSRKTRLVQVDLERGEGKELFVMVPGCMFGSRIFDDARKVIRATRADADLMLVDYPSFKLNLKLGLAPHGLAARSRRSDPARSDPARSRDADETVEQDGVLRGGL